MEYNSIIEKIFESGKGSLEDMEVFIENGKEIEIDVFEGELNKYNIAESGGLSLRGISNGKMGYSYTEKIDESSIDLIINDVIENSKYIDSPDKEEIFSGSSKYEEVELYNENLSQVSLEKKIDFVKALEKEALSLDERVVSVSGCSYGEVEQHRILQNTKGVDLEEKKNIAYCYISVVVKENEDIKTGSSYIISNDFSDYDYKSLAKEAVEEGLSMLGAKSIESGNYPIIFRNDVFANILETFVPVFSAENVQKGLSLLKDRIDSEIASPILTLSDDPFIKDGVASRAFDDEGMATKFKKVIDKGTLKTYFYNWKTAKKDRVSSTGNGYRGSYKSSLSIAPTNLYVESGKDSFEDLIKSIDHGLLIIDVQGLHSGANAVSGDYSLSAYGYEIEGGKIKRPVNQITIAGNFYDTLKNIEKIGNDLKFVLPGMGGQVGSPSVKVKSLSVSGE
ncbi:TldD/PmbA family protein [Anaerosalibacter bizertensis]|uniref:TldD/PmbA family protein n=1 Tax=Anaerosalibacter bizertensis TaxID=932217 RepID=A0A844FGC5_9FIRM|nr:TldD/PmbA family protein [Anaerosalibacter bizertensis]MBU5292665.1 TldD/PmbA family protein [Anaerosalibacter bizertensis]MSS43002.1 TldD/PmbA family protein [Anaerosalibacter bizertensis]